MSTKVTELVVWFDQNYNIYMCVGKTQLMTSMISIFLDWKWHLVTLRISATKT